MSDAIECPDCGHTSTRVVDTRPDYARSSVRRRRECTDCGVRWFTLELMADRVDLLEEGLRGFLAPLGSTLSAGALAGAKKKRPI